MIEFEYKPGDDKRECAKVEGAEEYTVGQGLDCMFNVVKTDNIEARKTNKDLRLIVYGKFDHRCEAEEYARWLHSGKTANKEFSTDDFKKKVTDEAVRVLKETLSKACNYFIKYGRTDARKEILRHLGLDCVFEVMDNGDPEFDKEKCEQSMRDALSEVFDS